MSKQASRIFQEMPLIELLLHQSISDYDPTQDDAINETMKELLHSWLDMGIRVFDAEEEWHTGISEITDMEDPYEEDAVNGCLI